MAMKRLKKKIKLVGIDQSAAGSAAVLLENGKLTDKLFYADTKTAAKKLESHGAVIPRHVKNNNQVQHVERIIDLKYRLGRFLEQHRPNYAALEAYSVNRQAYVHVLGEVGGIVRMELARLSIPYKVYEISFIKKFATGKGNAEKADMVLACRDQWEKHNFLEFGKTDKAAGNLADAYAIAQMLKMELNLRSGKKTLDQLEAHQREVFLKTTKYTPVNILDDPFITVDYERGYNG